MLCFFSAIPVTERCPESPRFVSKLVRTALSTQLDSTLLRQRLYSLFKNK